MTAANSEAVIKNIRIGQAVSAALMSLEGLTPEQFAAKYPGVDIAVLMADLEFQRLVELVPARIVWTRFCNSGRLSDGIRLTGFEG